MKATINKIVREDNFLSLAGNLLIAILGFAGFALLARSYTPEIFGEWVIFISAGAFVEMFRFGITNTALIRYLSGADKEDRNQYIGSNWMIGLLATLVISLILILSNLLFTEPIKRSGYELFFTWYPLLALINLPFNTALLILQADQRFGKMLWIKLLNSGGFFLVLVFNYVFFNWSLKELVWWLLIVNFLSSLTCMILGWDGITSIRKASVHKTRTLLDFGKYTTFTLIGTNLLRSADTLIISLSPLGTAAVALYSIPLKLTEIQQIPLRSFVATAFPKMSRASIHNKLKEVKDLFYTYSGAMSYLFIFISLFTFVFAELFVLVLGGRQYLGTDPVTGFNTVSIVRIFSVYGLLLPIDRMTGIGLDSINKPGLNALKVFVMVTINVIGDLVAIYIFKSLAMVALASIFFTAIGIWIGFHFLNKELDLKYSEIFRQGITFYRKLWGKFNFSKNR